MIVKDTVTIKDTVVVTDTVGCYNLNDGLIAYYNFNGGNLNDSSGNYNNIVFSNATKTADRFGNPNNAYLFDGSTSYMQVSNSASLNPDSITIMAIVKVNGFFTGPCHANQILGKGWPDYADGFYCMRFTDTTDCNAPAYTNGEHFEGQYGNNNPLGSATGALADSNAIQTGQWYNVVYTYDGTKSRLYINGVLKDELQKTIAFTANNQPLTIGKHLDPNFPYWFNGVIDEIRIYKKAFCAKAVAQLNLLQE